MEELYDVIIVGAGTAGLTAAIYGRRAGLKVLILEEGIYGGQIVDAAMVENYPGIAQITGYQFAQKLYEQAIAFGAELITEKVTGLFRITEQGMDSPVKKIRFKDGTSGFVQLDSGYADLSRYAKELWEVKTKSRKCYRGRSVILATGARKRKLNIENEDKWVGKGISYCATCDGAFYRNKEVAVIGGGAAALENAEYLARTCKKVYLIHRSGVLHGDRSVERRLRTYENVEILRNRNLLALEGGERLEALRLFDREAEEELELRIDGVFVAIGQEPVNQKFRPLLHLDPQGYIMAGEECRTNVPGVFAAGDCRTKQIRQLTTAAADGTVAAQAALAYVEQNRKDL